MFNFLCEECGKGIVKAKTFHNYPTKIDGYPFVVDDAIIGICEKCGAEHFSAKEYKRWKKLFYLQMEQSYKFLSSKQIMDLREQLGLNIEQFALLIGSTGQSVYNWEKVDRKRPQPRMADLLLKLLKNSLLLEKIDVLKFLQQEAARMGVHLDIELQDGQLHR